MNKIATSIIQLQKNTNKFKINTNITNNFKQGCFNNTNNFIQPLFNNINTSSICINNNNNKSNISITRYYGSRNYNYPNHNDDGRQKVNFFPSKHNEDSHLERIAAVLVSFGVIGLLIYVFYDGAEEIIINNLVYKKTVDSLRLSEQIKNVFGEDFTARGLGIRSNGKFTYHHRVNKNGENIVFINYIIESEKGLVGHVECKAIKKSLFDLEVKILKVKYGKNKTITLVDETIPKKLNSKIASFLSIFGYKINNNGDNSASPSPPTPAPPKK